MAKQRRELAWRERIFVAPKMAAQILNESQSGVYQLCVSKELPAIKVGRRWRIPTRALIEYAAKLQESR